MYYDRDFWETLPEVKPTTPSEPWQKLCLDAAQYIREHGWCQGELSTDKGEVCLVGALEYVSCRTNDWVAYTTAREKLQAKALLGTLKVTLPNWNDMDGRTKEQVIDLLEAVAKGS